MIVWLRSFTHLLIRAIENLNNVISYFKHDIKRGNARKTVAIAIVLLFIIGLSFVGTSVTGQITRARESAVQLSEKLGATESAYEKLSINYGLLKNESEQCAAARDKVSGDLSTCKYDLSVKVTEYGITKAKYDKCSSDLSTKTSEYNTCSDSLKTKSDQLDDKSKQLNDLNTSYSALQSKHKSVTENAVIDNCCKLTTSSTVDYYVDDNNKIKCFDSSKKQGTVNCP